MVCVLTLPRLAWTFPSPAMWERDRLCRFENGLGKAKPVTVVLLHNGMGFTYAQPIESATVFALPAAQPR
jgi:hypothetical protein